MKKLLKIGLAFCLVTLLNACGGGTPLTIESNNQSLLNYINALHTSVEPAFIAAEKVSTSPQPQINYEAAIQSFLI